MSPNWSAMTWSVLGPFGVPAGSAVDTLRGVLTAMLKPSHEAEEALASFDRHHREIAMVVSDLTLPGRDGKYLANRLRSGSVRLPILLTSGYSHAIREDVSQRLFYLAKPFSSASLLEAVRRCLSEYHSPLMPNQTAPLCPGLTVSW